MKQPVYPGVNLRLVDTTTAVYEKLVDALAPGFQPEFDPHEAEQAGAFVEDALSEQEALDSTVDLMAHLAVLPVRVAANDEEGQS